MSTLESKVAFHEILFGRHHSFVQDPNDIPGGCLTCWEVIGYEVEA
jgi:hypothetical protein